MDIEKLIERLRSYTYWLGQDGPESHDIHPLICDEAADAISTIPTLQAENEKLIAANNAVARDNAQLQAENDKLRSELRHKEELVRQQAEELERRDKLLKEQEAELEQVKRERDSAREVICAYCLDIPCKGENCRWYCGPEER